MVGVVVVVVGLALVGGFFGDAAICWTGGGGGGVVGGTVRAWAGERAGPNVTRTTALGHGLSLTAADRRNGYCPCCSASWNTPDTGVTAVQCVCWLGVNGHVCISRVCIVEYIRNRNREHWIILINNYNTL